MSAAKHRAVAKRHERQATKHNKQYDPKAVEWAFRATGAGSGDVTDIDYPYNPTDVHRHRATEQREHARQHLVAAQTLDKFEGQQCRLVSKEKRRTCPILGKVKRAQSVPKGVRLYLTAGVPVKAVLEHMRCHYAYGRRLGRQGMDGCPLYLKNLTIRASEDHRFVEITSDDLKVAKEIRRRTMPQVSR